MIDRRCRNYREIVGSWILQAPSASVQKLLEVEFVSSVIYSSEHNELHVSHSACPVILESLTQFGLCVHHKRTIAGNRLVDRLSA
jgi:hypothetical protein